MARVQSFRFSRSGGYVLAQRLVLFQQGNDGIYRFTGGGVRVRENGCKVLLQYFAEGITVGFFYTQQNGQGVQVFAGTTGHVTGNLVDVAVHVHSHGLNRLVGGAAQSTGGHTESLVTEGSVGGGGQYVWSNTGLTFPDHGANTTARLGECHGRCAKKNCTCDQFFHYPLLYVVFCFVAYPATGISWVGCKTTAPAGAGLVEDRYYEYRSKLAWVNKSVYWKREGLAGRRSEEVSYA